MDYHLDLTKVKLTDFGVGREGAGDTAASHSVAVSLVSFNSALCPPSNDRTLSSLQRAVKGTGCLSRGGVFNILLPTFTILSGRECS